jgi:hypothetical protein
LTREANRQDKGAIAATLLLFCLCDSYSTPNEQRIIVQILETDSRNNLVFSLDEPSHAERENNSGTSSKMSNYGIPVPETFFHRDLSEKNFTKTMTTRFKKWIDEEQDRRVQVDGWRMAAHMMGFDVVGRDPNPPGECRFSKDINPNTIPSRYIALRSCLKLFLRGYVRSRSLTLSTLTPPPPPMAEDTQNTHYPTSFVQCH